MRDCFYRDFEDRYRGSRELVIERLTVYAPFLEALKTIDKEHAALDCGCGRGEWLEYVGGEGFSPQGVDLDDGMLIACKELGLSAHKGDFIEYIKSVPGESVVLVSAFHVVEHISFEELQGFVAEAMRVLKPGGLIILETPNPENIVVGAHSFYMDPTHEKPIPPNLLSFVTEHEGFLRNRVVRLQEDKELKDAASPGVYEILSGVSPDYAVIAQKPADDEILAKFDDEFSVEYGLSLHALSSRYDEAREARLKEFENAIQLTEEKTEREIFDLADRMSQVEARADKYEQELRSIYQSKISQVEAKVDKYEQELYSIYESKSWRVTAPIRKLARFLRFFKEGGSAWVQLKPGSRPRRVIKALLLKLKAFVVSRPRLKSRAVQFLFRFPKLHGFVQRYINSNSNFSGKEDEGAVRNSASLADLTPRARQIYYDLQDKIEQNKARR